MADDFFALLFLAALIVLLLLVAAGQSLSNGTCAMANITHGERASMKPGQLR